VAATVDVALGLGRDPAEWQVRRLGAGAVPGSTRWRSDSSVSGIVGRRMSAGSAVEVAPAPLRGDVYAALAASRPEATEQVGVAA
jgi:hypothetical protein